jgi:hypothetical protein
MNSRQANPSFPEVISSWLLSTGFLVVAMLVTLVPFVLL